MNKIYLTLKNGLFKRAQENDRVYAELTPNGIIKYLNLFYSNGRWGFSSVGILKNGEITS